MGNTHRIPTFNVEALSFTIETIVKRLLPKTFFILYKEEKKMNLRKRITALSLVSMMSLGLMACSTQNTDIPANNEVENANVLRVGMECAYAPNNWQEDQASDTNLPIENVEGFYAEGYDVQMAKLVGEKLDAEIVIVKLSWDGLIDSLKSGQIDMVIAGMADTEDRRQSINFSNYYSVRKTEYVIVVDENSKYASAESLSDFSGASILGQKNTKYDEVIDQIEGVDHLPPVTDVANMVARLNQGAADGIVLDTEAAVAYTKVYPNLVTVSFPEGQGFELGFQGACIGLRKEDTALLDQINAALAEIPTETRQKMLTHAQETMPQ